MIIGSEHAPKTTMNRTQDTKESEHWLVAVKQRAGALPQGSRRS